MQPRSRLLAPLAVACAALGLLWLDSRSSALGRASDVLSGRMTDVTRSGETGGSLAQPGATRANSERRTPKDREDVRAAAELAARTASIEVVVRARGSGQPIPGASAWIVDSSFRRKQCDDSGRVTFAVLPGKTLVGGEPPRGSEYIELAYDPVTDEVDKRSKLSLGGAADRGGGGGGTAGRGVDRPGRGPGQGMGR